MFLANTPPPPLTPCQAFDFDMQIGSMKLKAFARAVDGIELVLWGAEKMQIPYDLSWLSNGVLSKDLVNAFIALELNGWVEPVRLPMVIAATPKASAWLKEKRGQNVPAPEASLSPAERARAKNKAKKKA